MSRIPLALQVGLALALVLGIALGAGFIPALRLEAKQAQKERERGWSNLALALTVTVAARARGESDDAVYLASMERLLSVQQLRDQLVSVGVESSLEGLAYRWENPELAHIRKMQDAEGGPGPTSPIQTVRVLLKGEQRADLAVITLELSRMAARFQMERLKRRQWVALGLSLLLVLGVALVLVGQISRPVRGLIGAMDAFARGRSDGAVQPSGAREIRRLGEAFNRMAGDLRETERLKRELEAARKVQAYLLPKEPPALSGYRIEGICLPAAEVGGDFYQYYRDESSGLSLVIGDVSGKGLKAAMLTSLILGALQTLIREMRNPAEVLARLNGVLCHEIRDQSFATVLFCHLDPKTGSVTFANAGHLYPFYFRASSGAWSELPPANPALPAGLAPGGSFEAGKILLAPGDRFILMSDGIVEAMSPSGELFGYERLTRAFSVATSEGIDLATHLMKELKEFSKEAPQADDITLVAIHRAALSDIIHSQ